MESATWRSVVLMMTKDMEVKPKLSILKEIAELELESSCRLLKKRERSMLRLKPRHVDATSRNGGSECHVTVVTSMQHLYYRKTWLR